MNSAGPESWLTVMLYATRMSAPSGMLVIVNLSPPLENSIEPPRIPVLFSLPDATSKAGGPVATWPQKVNGIKAIRLVHATSRPSLLSRRFDDV
jgi:hypothetical protein